MCSPNRKGIAMSLTLSKLVFVTIAFSLFMFAGGIYAEEPIATLRGDAKLNAQPTAPTMTPFIDSSRRQSRNYPEQPPVIPHDIEGYQINLNANKCLSCHARSRTSESGAPMISITHFMDKDGQFKAAVTPRRYFCTQCHVSQHEVTPLVENEFIDIDQLIRPSN